MKKYEKIRDEKNKTFLRITKAFPKLKLYQPKDIKEQFVYKINELIFKSIKKVRIAKSRPASDKKGKLEDIFDIFENLYDIDGYLIIMLSNKKISDKKYSIILEVFDQLICQLSRWSINLRKHLLDAGHN